jgi:hypothetical protein
MRKILFFLLLISGVSHSQSWQPIAGKQRFTNGLGLPTKDTATGTIADSSQIIIRGADSSIWFKYKSVWQKLGSGSSGTVKSVKLTTPTGLSVTGSPITDTGTLAITYTSGYSLPTIASQALWDAAYTARITTANAPLFISSNTIRADTTTRTTGLATNAALINDSTVLANAISSKLNKTDSIAGGYYPYSSNPKGYLTSSSITGYVPYTGATSDVDLGAFALNAASVKINGTNGNGHLHLRHQASDATATGQSTVIFANSNGDLKWKNAGNYYTTLQTYKNTADRIYTYQNKSYTLADSTTVADSVAALRTAITSKQATLSGTGGVYSTAGTISYRKWIDSSQKTYSGTITYTGGTAPSGTTNHSYEWGQKGRTVTFRINISFGTAGLLNTSVALAIPSDMPTPVLVTDFQSSNDDRMYHLPCNGGSSRTIVNPLSAAIVYNGGTPIFKVFAVAQNLAFLEITGNYFTNN